jgi:small membrane protein
MRLFQILAIVFVAAMLVVSVRNLVRLRARPLASAFWLLLWTVAGASILSPDSTTRVALLLGIRRGADLLIYCTALALCVGFFLMYVKVRQLSRDITLLTRELAIRGARPPAPGELMSRGGPVED